MHGYMNEPHYILTVPINIFITLITKFINVCVFLVIVFHSTAVVAGITKVILINVPLVHVGHQNAIVLLRSCFSLCELWTFLNVYLF